MKYRRDIDGLRAIAVLPVVLFHAHAPFFGGGYVGVDIFFVISGYLITTIIANELESGTFSFLRFYERRARRILPALLVVVLAATLAVLFITTPAQMQLFAERGLAVLLFVSNFQALTEDNYFGDGAEANPFIHTWSLAIEEQFYIFFPILMVALWRSRKQSALVVVAAISLLSLLAAEWLSRTMPMVSFYMLPTRAWELGAGALVALAEQRWGKAVRGSWQDWLPLLGLALIVASILAFDSGTNHPGLLTAIPVAGAVFIIAFGGGRDYATRLLSTRLLVGIGLISYSLYLWHQPAIALVAFMKEGRMRAEYYAGPVIASFLLAWLTWKYVETPFRNRNAISLTRMIRAGAAIAVPLSLFFVASIATRGFEFRKPEAVWKALAYEHLNPVSLHKVNGTVCMSRNPASACPIGDPSGRSGVALVGDSHAAVMGRAFSEALAEDGRKGVEYTQAGCPFVPGFLRRDRNSDRCAPFIDDVLARITAPQFDTIFLAGRYTLQYEGDVFDNREGGRERGEPAGYIPKGADGERMGEDERKAAVAEGYKASVEGLLAAGKRVVLIYPIPEVGWHVPRELAKRREAGDMTPLTTSYDVFRQRNLGVMAVFDAIPDNPNLVRVFPEKVFCNTVTSGRCELHNGDTLYYVDDDHLSMDGARLVVREAIRAAERAWPDFKATGSASLAN